LAKAHFKVVRLKFPWKGSSLTDKKMALPVKRTIRNIVSGGIPSTYVPARNTVFLSIAASYAEAIGADRIFIGAHSEDSSGYPDCRREYLKKFAGAIRLGTKRGLEGKLSVEFPLINKTKSGIIKLGVSLGVPFEFTRSCYKGGVKPCGECDSCILRAKGFKEAGVRDIHLKLII
jgi:7-cyano-7-deazaguanine synthase